MNPSVGQRLRSAREELGIRLEDAARETHIRLNYLQELENDHPELLHSMTQARGFLRLYADFLNLPFDELLSIWEKTAEPVESAEPEPKPAAGSPVAWLKRVLPLKSAGEPAGNPAQETPAPASVSAPEAPQETPRETPQETPQEAQDQVAGTPPDMETQAETQTGAEEPESFPQPESPANLDRGDGGEDTANKTGSPVKKFITRLGAGVRNIPFLAGILKREKPAETPGSLPDAPGKTSDEMFRQIGLSLQNRRKLMDLSLADIENFTNLKRAFLVALEEGRFGDLPSTVQGRGMLNNYAKFLGMEESTVMQTYAQALQLQREEKLQPQRKPAKPAVSVAVNLPERWRKVLNPDLIIGSLLIVGLFAFIIWGALQVFNSSASASSTEAPSISEMLQVTPSLSPQPDLTGTAEAEASQESTALPGVAVVESTPTAVATVNSAPLQVYIIAHDRAYLDVTVDGKEAFVGRVVPNNVYTYSGNTGISLLTGNASALEVYFNQEYIGKLGGIGEVKKIDFTTAGLVTPTPEVTPTLTPTPNQATQQAADAASRQ
jgi:cytoskeleton protein RodZ